MGRSPGVWLQRVARADHSSLCVLHRGPTFRQGFPSVALTPCALDSVPTHPKVCSSTQPRPALFPKTLALPTLGLARTSLSHSSLPRSRHQPGCK